MSRATRQRADMSGQLYQLRQAVDGAKAAIPQDAGNPLSLAAALRYASGSPHNPRAEGAKGNGSTDDRTALSDNDTAATTAGGWVVVDPGTYRVASNATLSADYHFLPGAYLKPDDGVSVTLGGTVTAGAYEIFKRSSTGKVILDGQRDVQIAWFDGSSLNARWTFFRDSVVDADRYNLYINTPYPDQNGAYEFSSGIWGWELTTAINFDDSSGEVGNYINWYQNCPIAVTGTGLSNALNFTVSAKVENINLYNVDLEVKDSGSVNNMIRIQGAARVHFHGLTRLQGYSAAGVYMDANVAPVSEVWFEYLRPSAPANTSGVGLLIEGSSNGITSCYVDTINTEAYSNSNQKVVSVAGLCRNLRFGNITYRASGGSTLSTLMEVIANGDGTPLHGSVGSIYSDGATVGFKMSDSSSGTADKMEGWHVGPVQVSTTAFDVDWCDGYNVFHVGRPGLNITTGSGAREVAFVAPGGYGTLTDNGSRTKINGLITESSLPSATNHIEGSILHDTTSGNVYIRDRAGNWLQIK